MAFDDILEKVGPCGRYQLILLAIMIFSLSNPTIVTVMNVITGGGMEHFCILPNSTNPNITVTVDNVTQCSIIFNSLKNNTPSRSIPCTAWTYSQDAYISTIVSAFDLVCDRAYLLQISSSIYFIGFMIGSTGYGYISDKIGRQKTILVSLIHQTIFVILGAFSKSFVTFALFKFVTGMGNGGILVSIVTMTSEITSKKYRPWFVMNVMHGWPIGVCILALTGYYVRNHVHLQIILGCFIGCFLLIHIFLDESVRWLYNTKKFEKAEMILRKIAKFNGKSLDDMELFDKTLAIEIEENGVKNMQEQENFKSVKVAVNIFDLFRYPNMRLVTFIVWFNWFIVALSYFGVYFMLSELKGNLYLNLVLLALVELPSRAFGLLITAKFGRIPALILSYGGGGIALMVCAFIQDRPDLTYVVLGFAIIGQFFFAMAFDVFWMYSTEVFPTEIRNTCVGLASMFARSAGIVAPLLKLLQIFHKTLPFMVLGILAAICCAFCFLLPETAGITLLETLKETEEFIRNKGRLSKATETKEEQEVFTINTKMMDKITSTVIQNLNIGEISIL